MPVSRKIPPLPRPDVPVIDPRTGLMHESWRRFFVELITVLEEMRGLIP